jgi:hypothetical protein
LGSRAASRAAWHDIGPPGVDGHNEQAAIFQQTAGASTMKTSTVVELTRKEIDDAIIATAKQASTPAGGGSIVELVAKGEEIVGARVTFTWGAKTNVH